MPKLVLDIAANTIVENSGQAATTATISRSNADTSLPLVVTLTNGDPSEIGIPNTVTIPADQFSTTFDIDAVDDNLVDGNQTVSITAMATGFNATTDSLDVSDFETLALNIAAVQILEAGGVTTATVTRTDITVTILNDNSTQATSPATIVISDGDATSAAFQISAVIDAADDGNQTVNLTARATGYVDANDSVLVIDDDSAGIQIAETSNSTEVTESGFR